MSDSVRVERVTFESAGETLVGALHLPATREANPRAIVVAGAWRTVKEQMPVAYAREMAARGYAALAFDFRGWGESGGHPRRMEDPSAKADDIVAAAKYLADGGGWSVGALGICAGGAYTATAATRTDLIGAVALVAPALPSRETVMEQLGGEPGVAALNAMARDAQERYARTGQEVLVPAVEPGSGYYSDPARGAIPEWDNTFNPASWSSWLDYDAQAAAPRLTQPLLVVHSEAAASPRSVHEFVALVPHPVREVWLDDVTQFDFYDRSAPMATAADAVAAHFQPQPAAITSP